MRKYSRNTSLETLKRLLARSGNQCAFPDCKHPIFDNNDVLVAQLCHIEGVAPSGQRHNPHKSDEETNSYENLLFLCYRHHKVTDNVNLYTVEKLKEIKTSHEAEFTESTYQYSSNALNELVKETNSYWGKIEELHANHVIPDLAVAINSKSDILALLDEINENLSSLHEVNSVLISDCEATHFEYVCLAFPNLLTRIGVALDQIEIKYTEELLTRNPEDQNLKVKLTRLRKNFEEVAQSAGLMD